MATIDIHKAEVANCLTLGIGHIGVFASPCIVAASQRRAENGSAMAIVAACQQRVDNVSAAAA